MKRILGLTAATVLALAGSADARNVLKGHELSPDRSQLLDQQIGRTLDDHPTYERTWGGDDLSTGSQNHAPDWARYGEPDHPAPRGTTGPDTITPDPDARIIISEQHSQFQGDRQNVAGRDELSLSDASLAKARPHVALLGVYVQSALANERALEQSQSPEARRNLDRALTSATRQSVALAKVRGVDTRELTQHLRQARSALKSSNTRQVSEHLDAAVSSYQRLAQDSRLSQWNQSYPDRTPVSGSAK